MKKYSFYFSIILSILLVECNNDIENPITIEDKNQDWGDMHAQNINSSIEESENGWMIENNTFYPHNYDDGDKQYVFQINEKQTIGTIKTVKDITISPIWSNVSNTAWSLKTNLSSFEFKHNVLTTTLDNIESEDYYALYNIENGNQLIQYTYARLDAQFSQADQKRFLGFLSQQAPTKFEEKNVFGIFTYASQEKTIQQLIIKVKDTENLEYISSNTPDMKLISKNENNILLNGDKTIYFSNLEENSPSDSIRFDIEMTTYLTEDYETIHFTIPIINDAINIDSLQYYEQIFDIELIDF